MKTRIVVSDTTAITHLAKIGALKFLQKLYVNIYIPEAVHKELTSHGDNIPGAKEVAGCSWIKIKRVKNRGQVRSLMALLDPGESEAIALAKEMNADLLIIDEKIGRMHARTLGLNITGMIGILLAAKERCLIPYIKPYLDRLIFTKFKLSLDLYDQALVLAGEKSDTKRA